MQVESLSKSPKQRKNVRFCPWIGYALAALCLVGITRGHVVSHVVGEMKLGESEWSIEMVFDVGLAFPELRQDPDLPRPEWQWFDKFSESELRRAELGAEEFLSRRFALTVGEGPALAYTVEFPQTAVDRDAMSPAFAVRISGNLPKDGGELFVGWLDGKEDIVEPSLYLVMNPEASSPPLILPIAPDGVQFIATVVRLEKDTPRVLIERNPVGVFLVWLKEGIIHVVPGGLDHIAFILGMFLAGGGWRFLLGQSLVFTVAHSVTLIAAAWGVVAVPSGLVEPMIALSIAWIAAENVWRGEGEVNLRRRCVVVFCFGLVHGLGFAGALSELTGENRVPFSELIGFNLGVEIGQVIVLTFAMAALALVERIIPERRSAVVRVCSALIAAVGIIWFVQRLVGL